MTVATPDELLLHELKDLFYVEKKLSKVLTDIAGKVQEPRLAERLEEHQRETVEHGRRLEAAFAMLGERAVAEQCKGFDGIKKEYDDFVEEEEPTPEMYDLFVAGAAGGRIERYEISGYTSAIALAEGCGKANVAEILQRTLDEELAMLKDGEAMAKELVGLGSGRGKNNGSGDGTAKADLMEKTVVELHHMAADADIEGRSSMTKQELVKALKRAKV